MALRPFTPQELQELAARGYDISKYDGSPVNIPDPVVPKSSATKAGLRSALASAVPTLAGGAGFGLTMAALAPATMGTSLLAIPAAAAVGYGTGRLASYGQEKLLPEEVKQQLATDVAEHPVAATVGQLAALPLGGFNPSVANIGRAAGAIPQLLGQGASRVGRQALANVAGGAAIGGIQEAVMQPLEGREFSPKDIALAAGTGLLFSQPNVIGRRYGFHTVRPDTVEQPEALRGTLASQSQIDAAIAAEQKKAQEALTKAAKEKAKLEKKAAKEAQQGRMTGVLEDLAKGAKIEANEHPELEQAAPGIAAKIAADHVAEKGPKAYEGEKAPSAPQTESAKRLQEQLQLQDLSTTIDPKLTSFADVYGTEVARQRNIEQTINPELPKKGVAKIGQPVRETQLGPTADVTTPHHEVSHYEWAELKAAASKGDKFAQKVITDLETLSKPGLDAYNKAVESVNVERAKVGAEPLRTWNLEEFIVSEQGNKFIERQLNLGQEKGLRQWWNDTKALLKSKYGTPTVDEAQRAWVRRTLSTPSKGQYVGERGPLGEVRGKSVSLGAGNKEKASEKEEGLKEEYDYYKSRLVNPELLTRAELFEYKNNPIGELAVPLGGSRVSGHIGSAGLTKTEADYIFGVLQDLEGFPNLRISAKTIKGNTWYAVHWGKEQPSTHPTDFFSTRQIGKDFGYKEEVLPPIQKSEKEEGLEVKKYGSKEEVFLQAAKTTEPYKEWKLRNAKAGKPVTDEAFMEDVKKLQAFREDLESEPEVRDALRTFAAQELYSKDAAKAAELQKQREEMKKAIEETKAAVPKEKPAPKEETPTADMAMPAKLGQERQFTKENTLDVPIYKPSANEKSRIEELKNKLSELDNQRMGLHDYKIRLKEWFEEDRDPAIRQRLLSKMEQVNDQLRSIEEEYDAVTSKFSEAEEGLPTDDYLRYQDLSKRLINLQDSSVNMEVWRELENLKNKYKGFPPPKPDEQQVTSSEQVDKVKPIRNTLEGEGKDPTQFSRNSESGEGLRGMLPGLESTFDKAKRIDKAVGEAGDKWQKQKDLYWGKAQVALQELAGISKNAVDSAVQKIRKAFREELPIGRLTADERKVVNAMKKYFDWNVDERRGMGMKIEGRKAGKAEYYVPDMLNEKWIDIFTNKANSPEATYGKKLWTDYVMAELKKESRSMDRKEVAKTIHDYIEAMGSPSSNYLSVNFGAIRKAQGFGLPEGMRETSGMNILQRYGRKAAADMALFKHLESVPEVQSKLRLRNPAGKLPEFEEGMENLSATKEIRDMMRVITGSVNDSAIRHPLITSIARFVNNSIMGPGTGLRDIASVPAFTLPYVNKWSDLGAYVKGITNMRSEAKNALEYAAKQPQIDKAIFQDLKDSPNALINAIRGAASFMRKVQGREFLENKSRELTFSIGKQLALNNVVAAKGGHKQSQKFLEKFGTLVDGDITKMTGAKLEEALNVMAKNFTDSVQGTYGGSGLPIWTMEGHLAPFLALQKWSIEKSNTLFKDVVKPFYTGENRIPMLTYMFGSVLTGAGIQQLNELLSSKKPNDPKWQESLDKKDAKAIASQIATLLQLASFGGIVGDAMKVVSDVEKGKTPRNPLSFPAFTSTMDAGERIGDAVNAIRDGEDPFDILYQLSLDLMTHNVQAIRMGYNAANPEEMERWNKFRDVRVFGELEGKRQGSIPNVNKYAGYAAREFKQTGDVREALGMLPMLIQQQKEKAGGNFEQLRRGLEGLKRNSYQTMPSPRERPLEFKGYYDFLMRTQGKEEAGKRLKDYYRQTLANRIKASAVP